jgi:hypothetical protein
MTSKSLRAALLGLTTAAAGAVLSIVSAANAASVQRLPDGRVIITAFGERLAFREKDAARIDFFWPLDAVCNSSEGPGSTLARWLNDPKVADCLNRTIPDDARKNPDVPMTSDIAFMVIPAEDNGLIYPGGIKPDEISKTSLGERSLNIALTNSYIKGDCTFKGPGIPDNLGYALHRISKSPGRTEYMLKASERIGGASRPLCVSCGDPPNISCAVHLISSDEATAVYLGWDQGYAGPEPDWLKYDAAARKIAQSIFIDRPAGDFQ